MKLQATNEDTTALWTHLYNAQQTLENTNKNVILLGKLAEGMRQDIGEVKVDMKGVKATVEKNQKDLEIIKEKQAEMNSPHIIALNNDPSARVFVVQLFVMILNGLACDAVWFDEQVCFVIHISMAVEIFKAFNKNAGRRVVTQGDFLDLLSRSHLMTNGQPSAKTCLDKFCKRTGGAIVTSNKTNWMKTVSAKDLCEALKKLCTEEYIVSTQDQCLQALGKVEDLKRLNLETNSKCNVAKVRKANSKELSDNTSRKLKKYNHKHRRPGGPFHDDDDNADEDQVTYK